MYSVIRKCSDLISKTFSHACQATSYTTHESHGMDAPWYGNAK